jgi:hypothetical protein
LNEDRENERKEMTNALTQGAYQTPLSRHRIMARYRAFGPPTELPELNCWSIEKHAGHLARCNSLTHFAGCVYRKPYRRDLTESPRRFLVRLIRPE